MREQMDAHRANPVCASCHKLMDPIGFALENFDAVGALAHIGRGRSDRRHRRAARRHARGRRGAAASGAAQAARGVRRHDDREAADLRARSRRRGRRHADRPRDRPRRGRQNDYRFSSLVLGIVKSPRVPDADRRPGAVPRSWPLGEASRAAGDAQAVRVECEEDVTPCMSRKMSLAPPDVPAWSRDVRWRCRCSTRWCRPSRPLAKTAANPQRRFGAVYIPHGAIMERYTPKKAGAGFDFTPILKPLEPFKDNVVVVSNLDRPGIDDSHATASAAWLSGAIAKKTEGQDFRLRPDGRSGDREADRRRHAVPVDRGGDREPRRLRRRLQPRLRLRLHEHDLLDVGDLAGADGDQPARRVRAPVRAARHHRAARGARAAGRAASSIRSPRTSAISSAGWVRATRPG